MEKQNTEKQNTGVPGLTERLRELSDLKYRDFHSKLLPGTENVMGVRTPELRKLAKEIIKGDWETFLEENDRAWYENDILQGLVTAGAKMMPEERLRREEAEAERMAEEARVKELQAYCEKKGLSFEEEEAKYQAKLRAKRAKQEAKKK